ncbi:hypothetical protein [Methylocella silvestris]|uniref:hypothetical protein n=1 Tax=Methylocella silvestris TaxID=199596 RepID=UPI0002F3B8EB|nr:hypothetical protein [Methylocella silvestris]
MIRFFNTIFHGLAAVLHRKAAAAEAERMIARFNDRAYFEARDRARGRCIDGEGSPRYWARVKREIARRQNIAIGLAGADLRA